MKTHGPWKIKETNNVYSDPFIHVWLDHVTRPDGTDGQHVVVSMKPGVCVLAIDEQLNLHLTKEFHYGIGRDSIEAVSGGIEDGEAPELTASRELEEELGLIAGDLQLVTTVDPFTTIVVSPTRIYYATRLSEGTKSPEGTELIEKVVIPIREAVQKIKHGEITHAPTCVAILLAHAELGIEPRMTS